MDNVLDKMRRAVATRKEEKKEADKRYNESSKERLAKIIETKLRTSFIGALSQFEEGFGHLWGAKKDDRSRTSQEKEVYQIWLSVRNKILNNGNNQIRAIDNELVQYTITWNRYQMFFEADKYHNTLHQTGGKDGQ